MRHQAPRHLPLYDSAAFDWNGFYAGIYGVVGGEVGANPGIGAGVNAGVNAQFDFYLVGAEVAVAGIDGDLGQAGYAQMLGRAGLVVADDVLLYGAGGYGIDLGTAQDSLLLGGGIEVGVTDNVSMRAQYLQAFPDGGGQQTYQFSLGANFHF